MKEHSAKNIAASVRARLYNLKQASGLDFDRLLLLYAQEGFLRRLAASSFTDQFILKGGILFYGFFRTSGRVTRDMDFLAHAISNDTDRLKTVIKTILNKEIDDGLIFDLDALSVKAIDEDTEYIGQRVKIKARLEQAIISMQIDLGFSDVVYPEPVNFSYPTLLSEAAIPLYAYSWETVIAEKFQAIVSYQKRTSRMKDFYDIYFLMRTIPFKASTLGMALKKTFSHRQTPLEESQAVFAAAFRQDITKKEQWAAFLRKSHLSAPPFADVLTEMHRFLQPLIELLIHKEYLDLLWEYKSLSWHKG